MPSDERRLRSRAWGSTLNFLRFYVSRGYLPAVVFWGVLLLFAPVEWIVYALTMGYSLLVTLAAAGFHFAKAHRRELACAESEDSTPAPRPGDEDGGERS